MLNLAQAITESPMLPFVLDLILKSTLVLLLACFAARLLRNASAALRHLVWSTALGGVLLLPVLSWALPEWRVTWWPGLMSVQAVATEPVLNEEAPLQSTAAFEAVALSVVPLPRETAAAMRQQLLTAAAAEAAPATVVWWRRALNSDWKQVLWWCWLAGLSFVLARVGMGTVRLWWLTRGAWQITDGSWLKLAQRLAARLRLRREIALLKSGGVSVPLTWGAWRSVVVLPAEADEWSDGCRSIVLLHELAHVKRRDCLTQLLAQVACALYWFNPLVWLAARRLREERELACDDHVLGVGTKASEYANYLVEIASALRGQPEMSPVAVGMACSQLESRVQAILDPRVKRGGLTGRIWLAMAVGIACLLLPLAALQPRVTANVSHDAANLAQPIDSDEEKFGQTPSGNPLLKRRAEVSWLKASATELERQRAVKQAELDQLLQQAATPRLKGTARQALQARLVLLQQEVKTITALQQDFAAKLAAQQNELLRLEQNSPGPVREAQSGELTPANGPVAQELGQAIKQGIKEGLRQSVKEGITQGIKQGISTGIAQGIEQGIGHGVGVGLGQGIGQGIGQGVGKGIGQGIGHGIGIGVGPSNVGSNTQGQGSNQSGELTLDQIIQMKTHNVTPEFIETMRRAGFENLSVRQAVEFRIHGIDEAYVKQVRGWGFDKATARDLVQLRVAGVTAEYLAALKQMGFENLSLNRVSQMRLHGVTPEFVETMRRLGFDKLTPDQVTSLRIHGVNEAYIKETQALSGEKLSVNDLLQFRISGVSPEYARQMKALGFENVPWRKLSQMSLHGVNEAYVREMRGLGFENLTVDQLLKMRIHGVTADYVKKLRAAGLKNVSVNQMIEMRIHGIDDILLKGGR